MSGLLLKAFAAFAALIGVKTLQDSLHGRVEALLVAATFTSTLRYAGLMLGSERLPAREKYCSTLASCGRWHASCLKTV